LVIVWLLGQALFAESQATNATCSADHEWAFNSEKQSPCVVASSLLAVCAGAYTVYSLPEQYQYMGPDSTQDANPCWCNTVVYSLLSECGLCQNRTITMWSVWEVNCPSVTIESFPSPLPSGLHVPGWAYLPVKDSDMFNESLAESISNTTKESTAVPEPSSTTFVSTSTSLAATTTPASSLSSASSSTTQRRTNAVGGGIVGGIGGLTLASIFGLWIYRRRRNAKTKGQMLNSPDMSEHRLPDATLPSQSESSVLPVPSIMVSTLESTASESIRSAQIV